MSQVLAAVQPRRIGRYTLIERLGVGGQSEVWRAGDAAVDVCLALKILAPTTARSAQAWAALEREFAVSSRLHHPGILRVLPPEHVDGCLVLPMELAEGGDLSRLRGTGYLQIVPVLLQVAAALQYAHGRGVVHRDLKPSNVLFDRSGRAKLADFGVAAVLPGFGAGQPAAGALGGSPFTASPGQLRGESATPADDIYGFGALAYELLAGHPPYYPHFDAVQIQRGPVPQLQPIRQAPGQLIELVMRMLATGPDERPASMAQAAKELESTLNATLALDLTELADLSAGPTVVLPLAAAKAAAPRHATPMLAAPRDAADAVPSFSAEAPPESAPCASAELLPRPMAHPPEALAPFDALTPRLEQVPQIRAMRHHGSRVPERAYGSSRWTWRPHRFRYLMFGLLGGAVAVGGALQLLAHANVSRSPLQMLSAAVSRWHADRLTPVVRPARSGALAPPAAASASESISAAGELAAQRRQFDRRLKALAARGAAVWDSVPFAAAKTQAAEASRAERLAEPQTARRHWQKAQALLATVASDAPLALVTELRAEHEAQAAGHERAAARAFALALRIDPGSPRAASGQRRARVLRGVRALMSEGHRAERAGRFSRAAFYFSQAVARDSGYAPARAALAGIKTRLGDGGYAVAGYERAVRAGFRAFANDRLFHAQADFEQALVFRPQGTRAAEALDRVNAQIRRRAAAP
jgi:hypothetical protein